MKNFPRVFETKKVSEIAIAIGIDTKYVKRSEEQEKQYFERFDLEVIEGDFQGTEARLEIVSFEGKFVAAKAFASGQEMDVKEEEVGFFKSQIVKK